MKKILLGLAVLICAFIAYSCASKVTSAPLTPAPKPATYLDTIAVAAKKSDFYVRMAFDLADMYLSVNTAANSVSRYKYGDDAKYLASYDFSSAAAGTGIIKSSAFGGLEIEYYNEVGAITNYNNLTENVTNKTKRDAVASRADTANTTIPGEGGARRCEMTFYNTDTPGQLMVDINFSTGSYGYLNSNGSWIGYPSSVLLQNPYLSVMNSSNTLVNFTVTINNITGRTQIVSQNHNLSSNDVFIINGGQMTITGIDNSGVTYTVNLTYANDAADGTITASNGFSANIHVDKANTYYYQSSAPDNKTYLLWDFPM